MENLDNQEENKVEQPDVKEPESTPKKGGVIEVPVSQLEDIIRQNEVLIQRLGELEEGGKKDKETINALKVAVSELSNEATPIIAEEGVKKHTLKLRFIDNKPVIGFVNKSKMAGRYRFVYDEVDPVIPTKINQYIDVILHGEEKPIKMLYNEEFMASDDVMVCDILEKIVEEEKIDQGKTEKVEYEDWSSKLAGYKVSMKVIIQAIKYKVKLPTTGEEIIIEERVANTN